ncbi:hypothetical protein K1719_021156 [Acacia pycnantha]|nr:hypothetical protein K1719_021156 [Acacia pycnantha]
MKKLLTSKRIRLRRGFPPSVSKLLFFPRYLAIYLKDMESGGVDLLTEAKKLEAEGSSIHGSRRANGLH